MNIAKWNYATHAYEPYAPDPAWKLVLYTPDMDELVNCAACGKEMTYGEGYTSQELHNHAGMGYPVCGESYEQEVERRLADRKQSNDRL